MNTKLEGYNIKKKPIGAGFFAKVYYAEDQDNNKCAVKVLSNPEKAKQEAFVMKEYGSHPYLPRFYDFFVLDAKAYIVMELIIGEKIGKGNFYHPCDKWKETNAVAITINLLKALNHLHNKGFLHKDILPQNILISENNPDKIKLIDFGMSVKLKPDMSRGKDLYNSGLLCLYLINGSIKRHRHLDGLDSINTNLKNILYKALNPNKKERFTTAQEFLDTLRQINL